MRLSKICIGMVMCLLLSAQPLLAQQETHTRDRGFTSYASFSEAHDSSLGWSTELNSSLGYDFNRTFSFAAGIPFFFVQVDAPSTTTTTPTQPTATSYHALGDFYSMLLYRARVSSFGYSGNVTGTAPTGNTSNGISSGRPTFGWNNRLDHEFWRLTPFAEAGIGSSINALNVGHGNSQGARTLRNYTTLGGMSILRVGTDFDMGKNFGIEGSVYDDLPFGNQKLYSHSVSRQLAHTVARRKNPAAFELNALTAGRSSIDADHGFDVGIDFSPTKRMDVAATYNRSVSFSLNTLAFTVGYRFGHVTPSETMTK